MTAQLLHIARFEYVRHARQTRFLFTTFGIPLLVAFVVTLAVSGARAVSGSGMPWAMVGPGDLPATEGRYSSREEAEAAVLAREIGGYVEFLPEGRAYARAGGRMPRELARALYRRAQTAVTSPAPEGVRELLIEPANVIEEGEAGTGAPSEAVFTTRSTIAVGISLLFALAVLAAASFLVMAVTEEKESRILELLVSSVGPTDLIAGKIVGLGLLSLSQTAVWSLFALAGAAYSGRVPAPDQIPLGAVAAALPYFLFGYLLYAGIIVGIGVVVGSPRESQQLTGLLGLFLVIPFTLIGVLVLRPSSPVAVAFSVFPLTAPAVMPMRLVLTDVPVSTYGLGLILLVAVSAGVAWSVGRVFRAAMLIHGQRLSLRGVGDALAGAAR